MLCLEALTIQVMSDECLIVGAGPTGLTLAIELKRLGVPLRLVDKAERATQWSQALVVQARTLEQFARYGIADEAAARGRKIPQVQFWSDGKLVASLNFDHIPSRFRYVLFLPQNETEQILTSHLDSLGCEIERKTELLSFASSENGKAVTADLRHADGRIEQTRVRWLVGCDGAHSTVRSGMGVSFQGDTVGLQFALGDLRVVGKDVPGDELVIHFHRGGDVLFVAKLKDDVHRVIVALHEQQNGNKGKMPELEDFNYAFQRFGLQTKAESAIWRAPFHVNQRKAGTYRQGNVFLAGDASHIHSPVGGQGMNTGIQDVANLAWKLAAVSRGADERLLDSYNEERGKVGDALLRGTSRGLRAATVTNPVLEELRDFVLHGAAQFEGIRDAVVREISETSIHYRDSSITVDEMHGHQPCKAGDRMPDLECRGTSKTLLRGLRKAVHLLVAVDFPAQELPRDLQNTEVLELNSASDEWTPAIKDVLGKGPQLFLVRPDGYIGIHGEKRDESFFQYAQRVGLLSAVAQAARSKAQSI